MPKGKNKGSRGGKGSDKKKEREIRKAFRRERRYKDGDPEFKNLTNQLAIQGLKLKNVPGDGNCLFRALVDQLGDTRHSHRSLRTELVEYMRGNKNEFEPFMEEEGMTYDEYLEDLMQDGTYGGNDIIVAFARSFKCSVVIHQPNAPRWEVHGEMGVAKSVPELHIAYLNGEHYCSVNPIDEATPPMLPSAVQPVSSKTKETAPQLSQGVCAGMQRMSKGNDLMTLMHETGCEDALLAENILQENGYDMQMAIVELLQLMDLSSATVKLDEQPVGPVLPSKITTPLSLPSKPSLGVSELKPKEKLEMKEKTNGKNPPHPQRHLSNRERKEVAKRERKDRRHEERKREKKPSADVCDPVGSLAI